MSERKEFVRGTGIAQILDRAITDCPDQDAIVFYGWHISYKSFYMYVIQTARWLHERGIGMGDTVGIISRNRPEFLIVEFALYKLGAIPVKINWRLAPNEISSQLLTSGVTFAFMQIENETWGRSLLEQHCDSINFFIMDGCDMESSSLLRVVTNYPAIDFQVHIPDTAIACHMHTSGTTAHAKTVVCTHGSLLDKMSIVKDMYGYKPGARLQFITQLFDSGAIGAWLCFATCGTVVLMNSFSTESYLLSIERERVNAISIIPTILKRILDELDRREYDLSSLEIIRYSTCPVSPALLTRAIEKLNCKFYQSYGMTEMGSMVTILSPDEHFSDGMSHLSTVGRPIPETEIRIVGPSGRPCLAGEKGEIYIKGPGEMLEYYGQPELTAAHKKDGWYSSGDMGFIDVKGYLTVSGRKDDLIISGGENIYPSEITNVLMKLDEISECCAFGVPDEIWGESVKACVTLTPGSTLTTDDIFNYCRQNMPHFKAPKEIQILDELPKNTSGKILINELKARAFEKHQK